MKTNIKSKAKRVSILFLTSLLLFSACSKKSNVTPVTPTKTTALTLVTKVIDNYSEDPEYGLPVDTFTYKGNQLIQSQYNTYLNEPTNNSYVTTITNFNYNTQGQLTGTTITPGLISFGYLTTNDVSSKVTYSGSNISSITFYLANNVVDRTVTLTYTNGLLTQLSDPGGSGVTNYTYNSGGNTTLENFIEYISGQPDGNIYQLAHSTFDTHSSFETALPVWIYLQSFGGGKDRTISTTPGKNNPLASTDSGNPFSYNYVYNSFGYPSEINSGYSYAYQYIQVSK